MPLWRGRPNTRTWPAVLLTLPPSKAAGMTHLCVPQNQTLQDYRGFVPDIQVCGTHGRDLVNATITLNTEEEENWHSLPYISRVPEQNGVSLLYVMLEIHHSGWEPSICQYAAYNHCTLGGQNSSVGSAWARCPQRCRFDPPLGTFSGRGDFSLGVNMGSNSIPPPKKILRMRV